MTPTVGRIVHYYDDGYGGPRPMAAMITFVRSVDNVDLVVFRNSMPSGYADVLGYINVSLSDEPKHGCWTWPTRVP